MGCTLYTLKVKHNNEAIIGGFAENIFFENDAI